MGPSDVKKPFTVYVLWDRGNLEGPQLARDVYRWFSAPTRGLRGRGLGVPVYYRSMPTGRDGRPIELAQAEHNLVVPLIGDCMALDGEWRADLAAFCAAGNCQVVPVALSEAAFHLPAVAALNCIRLLDAEGFEARSYRLRRDLTQVAARYVRGVLAGTQDDGPSEPLKVFLSHAKGDGREIAMHLRDAFQDYGQLRVFFDEVDLPFGYDFAAPLDEAANSGSAGVVSVLTDSYASRPWCRRELEQARAPKRDSVRESCWHIQPCVAISALSENPSTAIPELGRTSIFPWRADARASDIDLTVREIMIAGYHRLMCRSLAASYDQARRCFINWVPDPTSLLDLRAEKPDLGEVVYPGHGLPADTRRSMQRRFHGVALRTFEELD